MAPDRSDPPSTTSLFYDRRHLRYVPHQYIEFDKFWSGNWNAKFDPNSYIQKREGWLKKVTHFCHSSAGKMAIFHLLVIVKSRGQVERRRCRQRCGGDARGFRVGDGEAGGLCGNGDVISTDVGFLLVFPLKGTV